MATRRRFRDCACRVGDSQFFCRLRESSGRSTPPVDWLHPISLLIFSAYLGSLRRRCLVDPSGWWYGLRRAPTSAADVTS
eukprot:scaffold286870_cov30-Tisochrysis_lutea.AAC.5